MLRRGLSTRDGLRLGARAPRRWVVGPTWKAHPETERLSRRVSSFWIRVQTRCRTPIGLVFSQGLEPVVFVLSRFDGMTYSEIAMANGISLATVERRMAKAVEHCTAQLDV